MKTKLLIGIGIAIVGLVILGAILSVILSSLGGSRTGVTGIYPRASSPVELKNPSLSDIFVQREGGEVEELDSDDSSRLVIKTGIIQMVVKNIALNVQSIIQYAESKGGWVVSSSVSEVEKVPAGSITVRIPAEIFDEGMNYFKGLAEKVSYEATQGQDVTEEYTDLQSRLRNLQATETQLLKIMERSGTIPDVLSVQRELTNVRSQIEQAKGRIQYLEESSKMATISINLALSEELLPIPPAEKWRPLYIAKQAWRSILGSLRAMSYLLIWLLVYAIIWIPLGVIAWQARKFWKNRKAINKV